jgi:glucan phosphoethanolaminetransferase (alkaline phosphatase superfamily)
MGFGDPVAYTLTTLPDVCADMLLRTDRDRGVGLLAAAATAAAAAPNAALSVCVFPVCLSVSVCVLVPVSVCVSVCVSAWLFAVCVVVGRVVCVGGNLMGPKLVTTVAVDTLDTLPTLDPTLIPSLCGAVCVVVVCALVARVLGCARVVCVLV